MTNTPAAFQRFRPHPWHGLPVGPNPPHVVTAYIEITPFDTIKYEVDKPTGYIRVDRPQRSAAQPPTLYGFIPRTYCGEQVAQLSPTAKRGDGDPLDICVVSEQPITRADIIMNARVLGGMQMVDRDEADDKIIAVLENDLFWGACDELSQLPEKLVERLRHYLSTYKFVPGGGANPVVIDRIYDRAHAATVIEASMRDYQQQFGA